MTKEEERKIFDIFKKHIDSAVDEIAGETITSFYWGNNINTLIAEQATNTILAVQDCEEERVENEE